MNMRQAIVAAVLALATTVSAQADGTKAIRLRGIEAQGIDLGAVSGIAYYTVEPGGFHVVATLAQQTDGATPMRVEAVLAPGQSVVLSTPHGLGEAPEAVEISSKSGTVLVRKLVAAVTN